MYRVMSILAATGQCVPKWRSIQKKMQSKNAGVKKIQSKNAGEKNAKQKCRGKKTRRAKMQSKNAGAKALFDLMFSRVQTVH